MFTDEVFAKLGIADALVPHTVTVIGCVAVAVCGARNVLSASDEEVVVRLSGKKLRVHGTELVIAEIGGGDVLIRGKIGGADFE